jgi:hypothetical protein
MLVSTLVDDVRNDLSDQGITFYTQTDILDSLQDACDQMVTRSGLIEKTVDINLQANTGYYDLNALISDFYCVTQIYNNATRQWLIPQIIPDYDAVRDNWETWTGSPRFFTPVDYKRVVIVPRPTVTSGSIKVYYKAISPHLALTTDLPFPSDINNVPKDYAFADLLEQAREYSKASLTWKEANSGLGDTVKRTQARAMPALIYRLREMRYGY